MRWEKITDNQEEQRSRVVRALSFTKRTEDGCVVENENRHSPLRSRTSFTSFDVKKSRRNARTSAPMSTATLPNNGMRKSDPPPLSTQSLHRPSKINKLILRVPSDASEYKHCRVIHSTCVVPQAEGDGAQRLECISPSVSVVSQACQTNVPFNYQFPPEHVFNSTLFNVEESSGDLGSCSISNLSSVDGVSTQSRVSTVFGDDFSTPTRMGSTTRLVQTKKTSFSTRCGRCWKNEKWTTGLSVLSFACSLGNLLRLPRMAYFHGGGVFLLVYVLMTFVFGLPLMFLEIGLGQFSQHGTIKLWRAVNLFRGVGYAKTLLSYLLAISYSIQIGCTLSMFFSAVQESIMVQYKNSTVNQLSSYDALVSENPAVSWLQGIVFLSIVWLLVALSILKRSVTYKKLVYFLFPACVALTIAFFANASAQDTTDGLNKLFTFNWVALGDTQVWYFATVQMFFSLQLGFGSIGTSAGKIFPKTNALCAAWCVVCNNVVLGLAWVVLVYVWLGSHSFLLIRTPEEFFFALVNHILITGSNFVTGLLISLLVVIVGLFSVVALIYSITIAASIETKKKLRWRYLNLIITATACLIACLSIIPDVLSITLVIEHYAISHGILALTILELVGFAMIYGCKNVYNDLEFVIGSKLGSVWKSLWLVTPCVLFVIELCSAFLLPLNGETGQKVDATWQLALGWAFYLTCWVIVIINAVYQIWIQVDYNLGQKILSSLKPSRNWGPVDPIYRHCWVQWRNRYLITGSRDFTLKRRGTRDYTHRARTSNLAKSDSSSYQWPHSVQSIY